MGDHQELDAEISRLRDRRQTLETEMSNLQDIIQFNEKMLDGQIGAASDAPGVADNVINDPTDQLLADDTVSCWTCGSEVSRERIEETIDELQSVRRNYLEDVREIENELDELQETQRERESQQRRREKLERNIAEIEDELEQRQETLEDIREQREDLGVKIETVETEVEELESEDFSEVLDLHKEANQLEFELERLESNLDDITDRIANIEDHLTEEDSLREQREQIRDDLEDQRTRIDRIEQEAVEQFNEHMDEVLDLLEYDRLSRIWIERIIETVREGRGKTEQTAFELHVVRTTETNVAYEDTLDHLSESEREVTSLVFALAGYLVHDVHEQIPIMLLDSIEAIDSERIAALVDYISEFVEYLIIALLPEDAQAASSADTRIIDI
jgi:DNA repair exonuclease SbcCD ATPase subunit